MKAKEVMTTEVVTARPDTAYKHLVELMIEHHVSGVPIVDEQGRLVGIVTEADLVDKPAYGDPPKGILGTVHELVFGPSVDVVVKTMALDAGRLMTDRVYTAHGEDDVRDVARRLLHHSIKRMPVVDDDVRVIGIVSRRDLLAAFARPDEDIEADIAVVLGNPLMVPENASVEEVHVRDGQVVLRGSVEHPSDIVVVTAAVRGVAGVVDVDCRLSARSPEPNLSAFSRPLV